jgi:hypothetical protein
MNAIDRASHIREPLEHLAAAAEDDAAANMARIWTRRSRTLAIASSVTLLILAAALLWRLFPAGNYYSGNFASIEKRAVTSEFARVTFTVGGMRCETTRRNFQANLRNIEPDRIQKHFVEIDGRRLPVKQAVSVGLGVPRASFDSGKAITALRRLGFATQEVPR